MTWESWGTEHLPPDHATDEDWFTLGQISRWLAAETKGKEQSIGEALTEDFGFGKFDGPWKIDRDLSEESGHFVIVANPKVTDNIDLRWRTRWTDRLGRERWALLDSQSAQAIFAAYLVEKPEGYRGDDFWLCKEAINRWCDWHEVRRLASWPPPEHIPLAFATEDEIRRALTIIGAAQKWRVPALHDEVARLLGKRVSRRSLNAAKKTAESNGSIRLYPRGNPGR